MGGRQHFSSAPEGLLINVWSDDSNAFCFSPDGEWYAVWQRGARKLQVRRVPDGQLRNEWSSGRNYFWRLTCSPDGRLKLWHLPTGRELGTLAAFEHQVAFRKLAFSRDGCWLGALVGDGTLHLWHAPR